MKVIAKSNEGFLIEASEQEIKEILASCTGTKPDKIEIGNKIPAFDYASSVNKLKSLQSNHYYKSFMEYFKTFKDNVDTLDEKIGELHKLEE